MTSELWAGRLSLRRISTTAKGFPPVRFTSAASAFGLSAAPLRAASWAHSSWDSPLSVTVGSSTQPRVASGSCRSALMKETRSPEQPACDEVEDLRRLRIHPLEVVDEDDQEPLVGSRRKHSQSACARREPTAARPWDDG
jgi:hypothetical protein